MPKNEGTVQYSTVQYSTVEYRQYSTAQYSTVQYSSTVYVKRVKTHANKGKIQTYFTVGVHPTFSEAAIVFLT